MKKTFIEPLLKPLISLGICNLCHSIRAYTSNQTSYFSLGSDQSSGDNYVEDLQVLPVGLQINPLPVLNGYFQFIIVAVLLEILLLVFRTIKNNITNKNSYPSERSKIILPVSIFKMMLVSTLCYIFYTSLFIVTNFFWCDYIQGGLKQARVSLQTPATVVHAVNPHRHLDYETETIALSSLAGQIYTLKNADVNSMVLSNDGNTAFFVTDYDDEGLYQLNILNITDLEAPSLLGSLDFILTKKQISDLAQNGYSDIPPPIVLSPDEQMLYITAGPDLHFINVSDLTSPTNVSTYIPNEPSRINSFALSPDQQTLAVIVAPQGNTNNPINLTILSLENPASPNVTYSHSFAEDDSDVDIYFYEDESIIFGEYTSWKVYNISDLEEPVQIASLKLPETMGLIGYSPPSLVTFSPDFKTVCTCNTPAEDSMACEILNITNLTDPIVLSKNISGALVDSDYLTVTTSSDGRFLFITGAVYLQVYDISNSSLPVSLGQINAPYPVQFAISPNSQRAIISNGPQVYLVQMNLNVQASRIFDLQDNVIQTISNDSTTYVTAIDGFALSPDGSTLYSSADNGHNFLEVFNVSNPADVQPLSFFHVKYTPDQILISPDGETLFVASIDHGDVEGTPLVLMIYDIQSKDHLSTFYINRTVTSLAISPDGNTVFVLTQNNQDTRADFLILNVSNLTQPYLLQNISYSEEDAMIGVTLSQDGNIAFLTGSTLQMYNVSDPSSPSQIGTYPGSGNSISVMTSHDSNTAYITTYNSLNEESYLLEIVDISLPEKPNLLGSLYIPADDNSDSEGDNNDVMNLIDMSPDGNTLFLAAGGLTVVDITNPNSPTLLGYYSQDSTYSTLSVQVSPDYSTAFLAIENKGIVLVNLKPDYIFQLPSDTFLLGGAYSSVLNVLGKNPNSSYDANVVSYKVTSLSLYSIQYEVGYASPIYTYAAIPNWIDFDPSTQMLTSTPNSKFQVGSYSIYGELSKVIDNSLFIGINNITTLQEATQLTATLVSLGYLDDQGFLTSKFDPDQPLKIGSETFPNATEIHNILANHYFQAVTQISVQSSLNLTLGDTSLPNPKLLVNTLSLSPLNLNLTLQATNNSQAQFVNTEYSLIPSFAGNQTTLSVVGSLLDINTILSELIIFLNYQASCDGIITISDGLNPQLVQNISNISAYFRINSQPSFNATYFQSQINQVSIVTGEQFIIQFDYSTFSDQDGEDLTYTLAMQASGLQVPDWMTLRGLDLIGTPPQQLTGRNIDLKIVASNEYQSVEAQFTMHIGISWGYALKLVSSYGGGLITVLGFIFYFNKICNIVCKRRYRYPKDFTVRIGEEITSRTIYPVAFIGQQVRESKFLLKQLDKKVGEVVKSRSKSEIAAYFTQVNTYQIDKAKLFEYIGEVAAQIQQSNKADQVKSYSSGVEACRELIEQLIIKEMIIRLMSLKQEKSTKSAFEQLKESLFKFIELDKCSQDGICEFSVVRSKLYDRLRALNISISQSAAKSKETKIELTEVNCQAADPEAQDTQNSIEAVFLPEETLARAGNINIDLLVDALEAYAFRYHNMDADLVNMEIVATEKLKNVSWPRMIRRFLKKDLQTISYIVKGKQVGYGIEYETRKGFLKFSGAADYDLKDKTLVVQIINVKGRILREIWIDGVDVQSEEKFLQDTVEMEL